MNKIVRNFIQLSVFITITSCGGNGTELRLDHHIFVTSTSYRGGQFGGIAGADSKCATAAANAGLIDTYKAIISDTSSDVVTSLNFTGSVYKLTGEEVEVEIVANGSDLWNAGSVDLLAKVNRDENYALISPSKPWTGTTSDGSHSDFNCSNWTSDAGVGDYGSTNSVTDFWLEDPNTSACNIAHPLFCIKQ